MTILPSIVPFVDPNVYLCYVKEAASISEITEGR